jgi:hypothetical protein
VILILFRSVMSIFLSTSSFRSYEHDIMQLLLQTFALFTKGRKPLDTFFLPTLQFLRRSNPFLLETNRPEMNRGNRSRQARSSFATASSLQCFYVVILAVHTLRGTSCITIRSHCWFSPRAGVCFAAKNS